MRLARIVPVLLFVGCGGPDEDSVRFRWLPGGIREIVIGGTDIVRETGGYYLIGSCDHRDSAESNVTSFGSPGGTLFAPDPACPGAPFEIRVELIEGGRGVRTDVTVGPLPVAYASLSVPLDIRAGHIETFRTDVAPLFVGGCGSVEQRETSEGTFESIPTPCPPGIGGIGLAETRRPASFAVLEGQGLRIERRILSGDIASLQFFRNLPIDVENSEVSFGARPAGATVHLAEEISIH